MGRANSLSPFIVALAVQIMIVPWLVSGPGLLSCARASFQRLPLLSCFSYGVFKVDGSFSQSRMHFLNHTSSQCIESDGVSIHFSGSHHDYNISVTSTPEHNQSTRADNILSREFHFHWWLSVVSRPHTDSWQYALVCQSLPSVLNYCRSKSSTVHSTS